MRALKAHVVNGRIIVDEPAPWPEGTELRVEVFHPQGDDLDDEERAELLRDIDEGLADVDAGNVRDLQEVIASLGKKT